LILRCENISKSFKSGTKTIDILKNLSIGINAGDMIAIMGVSGSGKSTLLHILGLLSEPDYGDIYLFDNRIDYKDSKKLSKIRNENIGFVFQFYSLMSELNVVENVMLPSIIKNGQFNRSSAEKYLESVGIERYMFEKPTFQLSGGELQRVALARALMNSPKIVIADEPTANLDKTSSIDIVKAMYNINETSGQAFVVATHSEDITRYCNRVLFLSEGVLSEKNS